MELIICLSCSEYLLHAQRHCLMIVKQQEDMICPRYANAFIDYGTGQDNFSQGAISLFHQGKQSLIQIGSNSVVVISSHVFVLWVLMLGDLMH